MLREAAFLSKCSAKLEDHKRLKALVALGNGGLPMKQQRGPSTANRLISYEELKQHSTYADAWISINGIVYDITHFIPTHPFGDTFRGHLGTECGGLFSSAHANTHVEDLIKNEDFLRNNSIIVVGRLDVIAGDGFRTAVDRRFLDRVVYKETTSDEFWMELKGRVSAFLKDAGEDIHYTNRVGFLYVIYYLGIYALLSYLTWIEAWYLAPVLLGFHMICALANISHMATHHGFTKSKLLDFIAMYLYDLSGMSGLEWQITHQTHHNQPHSVIDHQTNRFSLLGVRVHKYMGRSSWHKYQRIYYWLVISFYLVFELFATTIWIFVNREFVRHKYEWVGHFLAKGILLAQIICCAYIHGYWTALTLFILYSVSFSQTAFILLFNNHEETHKVLGESSDVPSFHHKMSWAEVQVRTSGNWYPTNWLLAFVEFHYGYFNYHIEHHLFPTLKPSLLKKISPIVKSVCEKHGIPYLSTSFIQVQTSLQEHITKMGSLETPSK